MEISKGSRAIRKLEFEAVGCTGYTSEYQCANGDNLLWDMRMSKAIETINSCSDFLMQFTVFRSFNCYRLSKQVDQNMKIQDPVCAFLSLVSSNPN